MRPTLNLGRFLAKSGDLEEAIPNLQKAAALRPAVEEPHVYLADVYTSLGRKADAERERSEAERLRPASPDQAHPAPNAGLGSAEQH